LDNSAQLLALLNGIATGEEYLNVNCLATCSLFRCNSLGTLIVIVTVDE
jgi:hypothetical protein